jgi:hypothetical protein
VLVESFISIMITALIGGYVFFSVIRPPVRVRFSDKILLGYSLEGVPHLTFR